MTTPDTQLGVLYLAARGTTLPLRSWVLKTYMLRDGQLDVAMATTLGQLDQVYRFNLYYGYDVSHAPEALRQPITAYVAALRQGSRSLAGEQPSRHLFKVHRRIETLVLGTPSVSPTPPKGDKA
ncbi:MAG: hypothetical protein ABF537_02065 [Acetobacter sp.]|uniref:hypothetical protein n=1 Tax=Acetobacter sp. TaxID=440 RepID=UPI0039EC54F2